MSYANDEATQFFENEAGAVGKYQVEDAENGVDVYPEDAPPPPPKFTTAHALAVCRLLRRRGDGSVLKRYFGGYPSYTKIDAALRQADESGKGLDAAFFADNGTVTLAGKPFKSADHVGAVLLPDLQANASVLGQGSFGVTEKVKLGAPEQKGSAFAPAVVVKTFVGFGVADQAIFGGTSMAVRVLQAIAATQWQNLKFMIDVEAVPGVGYVMWEANSPDTPQKWLLQWSRYASMGVFHRDLKPDNTVKGELVDIDNILLQLGKLSKYVLSYMKVYPTRLAKDVIKFEMPQVMKMAGAKHGFIIVNGGPRILYIISQKWVDPETLLTKSFGKIWTQIAISPWKYIRQNHEALVCKVITKDPHSWPPLTQDQVKASDAFFEKHKLDALFK